MTFMLRIERHELGPRVYLVGRRVHEYQVGAAILAFCPIATVANAAPLLPWMAAAALTGLWLVVKDWPDLFPATRDRASWRLGLHRLPRDKAEPDEAHLQRADARSGVPSAVEESVA